MPFKNLFFLLVVIFRHAAQKIKCSCATVTSGIGSGTTEAHKATPDLPSFVLKTSTQEKKKQKTNSWIHTDSGSNALKGHSCTKQSSPVHHPKEAKCFTRSYLCASIQQPTGSAGVAELTRGSQQITSLDANPCLKYTRIPMMEQENALKTLKIQHSKTAGKGQWSRSCPDSWLPYRRYLPNTV